MRRVVTILIIVMVASALAACGGAPATTGTSGTPTAGTPTAGTPAPASASPAAGPTGDIYSPTQTVAPGEMFPNDTATVPASALAHLAAKKPMLVLFVDPTTHASAEQRGSVNVVMKLYRGTMDLVVFDYTVGLGSSAASATLSPDTQKIELLAAALKVNTTPYIVFVDRYGRIVYRFAGYVEAGELKVQALRATGS